ncbi:PD-(D/E)XK nuclease family protein [Natronomonas amylolytica]|uniref:PD-(D/E)XK nuclease family protein n=1 Tax=Natronomonas amylolytica TaxID=3108498 RepID=UPI003009F644
METNDYQRDQIEDAWREEHNGLRLTVSGLSDFALTIHERLFGPYPDIETLDRRRMIEQALLALDERDDLATPRHHTPSISELFREFEADGVRDASTLRERLRATDCSSTQRDMLVAAYTQYLDLRETIAHPEARSQNAKLTAVANSERSLQDAFPHLDAIVISGFIDPSSVELAVLERLADEFPVLVLLPTPTPDTPTAGIGSAIEETVDALVKRGFESERTSSSDEQPLTETAARLYRQVSPLETPPEEISWHKAPTPDREIRHLARRLRRRLATDETCTPDDILVLAPGLLSYREGIADIFDAYGIDHVYRVSILLERTHVGRAVLDAVELCEQPRSDRIGQLATNPLVDLPNVDATEVSDVQRRLYTTSIDQFTAELGPSEAGVESLLDHVAAVRDARPAEIVPTFERLLEHLGLEEAIETLAPEATIDAGYEGAAFSRISRILESVQTVCEELDPDEPLTEVATALEGVRVPPPPQVTDDCVELIGLQDTPMADFDELYVLGATDGNLSGTETRPRYFQSIGEALDLFERHTQRDRDRYRFGMLLANAKRVHITTPETTIDDEPLLVSPFVDELARVTSIEPTTGVASEARGAREDLQRAMAGADPESLAPALTAAKENGHVPEAFSEMALRGAECGSSRAADALSEHDGQLSTEAIAVLDDRLTKTPFSHTRLTRYAKCGFKYMLRTGWQFEADDDLEPGVSSLEIGSVIHETVERFYRGLQPDVGEPVDPTAFDRDDLERRLLEAGLGAVDGADESFDGVFDRATLQTLFAGLATPELNDYHDPHAETRSGEATGLFLQFLETELDRATDGHRPTYFEIEIGADDGVPLGERTVPIGGRVDRIDTNEADNRVSLFDYKSSSEAGARRRENQALAGVDFQLPLYMLGAPTLFDGRDGLRPHHVDAGYYLLNDGPTATLRPSLAERFDEVDMGAFLDDVVPDRIEHAIDGIDDGAFQPALVGESTAQCEYCEFSDVCDVRHHRRYDVIEQIDETDASTYVPDGARPGDTVEYLPRRDRDE